MRILFLMSASDSNLKPENKGTNISFLSKLINYKREQLPLGGCITDLHHVIWSHVEMPKRVIIQQ